MIQVTDSALAKLDEMRQLGGLAQDQLIGIGVSEEGMLRFDVMSPSAGDHVIEKDGTPVMMIPEVLADPLGNAVLDFDESGPEERFTLREATPEDGAAPGA